MKKEKCFNNRNTKNKKMFSSNRLPLPASSNADKFTDDNLLINLIGSDVVFLALQKNRQKNFEK